MRAPSLYVDFEGKDAIYDAMFAQAYQRLLFLRVVPGFTPSDASFAVAQEVLDRLRAVFATLGLDREESVDLWTALVTGLATRQVSNDPGGDRWTRLIEPAVDMLVAAQLPPEG